MWFYLRVGIPSRRVSKVVQLINAQDQCNESFGSGRQIAENTITPHKHCVKATPQGLHLGPFNI